MEPTYIKTDKNGTKYYSDSSCPKCGGRGYIYGYEHIDGGRCFKCGGTGTGRTRIIKEYTEEYAAKLEEKRTQKRCKNAPEFNRKFIENEGFNPDGQTYIVLGDTYSIKEELKARGAHFNTLLGWHFDEPVEEYPTALISIDDCYDKNSYGEYCAGFGDARAVFAAREAYTIEQNQKSSHSEHLGQVGERLSCSVQSHKYITGWDTEYGATYLYKFYTPEGNVLTWKTSKFIEDAEVIHSITGTVKEHTEYKGIKETSLTRCKLS